LKPKLIIEDSEDVVQRNLKIIFYGDTSTRKTETVLRYFPRVLLIDTEGNSDMCIGMSEIPPFKRVKTKDLDEIVDIIEQVMAGKIKCKDGKLVETICIDSASILWGVQQEVASSLAEKRAEKYNQDVSSATSTPLDWTRAKRPMKKIYNRLSVSPIRYFVLTARETDKYDENSKDPKKIGVKPDVMKGLNYDVNLMLHFENSPDWKATVEKVQGKLKDIFPLGHTFKGSLPLENMFEFASKFSATKGNDEEDQKVGERIASKIEENSNPKTKEELIKFGATYGISPEGIGNILRSNKVTFDPSKWDEITNMIKDASTIN